jgi:hypothetical protein
MVHTIFERVFTGKEGTNMHIYELNGIYIAEAEYQSERIVKTGKTWEEAKERLLTMLMVLEMIG